MTAASPSKDTVARGVAGSTQSSSVSKTFSSSSGSRPTSARRATRAKFRRPRLGITVTRAYFPIYLPRLRSLSAFTPVSPVMP